jgi:hypothetical protein
MHSMSAEELAAVPTTPRTISVDGANYQVTSKAQWVTDDAGGTPACGNSSKNNEYLHITTTVSSALVGTRTKPVVIDSLVAPSTQYSATHGILGVKVVDRNAVGVPGVTVKIDSASPLVTRQADTDANGCVIFKQLDVATYTITLTKANYVGTDLTSTVTASQKATPGTVTFKTLEYDIATTARVTVKTNPPAGSVSTQKNSKAAKISLRNAKVTGLVKGYANAAPASPLDVAPLYPFKATSYGFFTGTCAYQSPDTYDVNYFGSNPGSLLMDPTLAQPQAVTVLQPPLNLRITRNKANNAFTTSNLLVFAKPDNAGTGSSCTEAQIPLTYMAWPATGWGTEPSGGGGNWVSQPGAAYDPGMPYGKYTICVQDTAPNPDQFQTYTYDNTKAGGLTGAGTPITNASWSWSSTSCVG